MTLIKIPIERLKAQVDALGLEAAATEAPELQQESGAAALAADAATAELIPFVPVSISPATPQFRPEPLGLFQSLKSSVLSFVDVLPDAQSNRAYWTWLPVYLFLDAATAIRSNAMQFIVGMGPEKASHRGYSLFADQGIQPVANFLAGPFANRFSAQKVAIATLLLIGIFQIAFAPILSFSGYGDFWIYFLGTVVIGFILPLAKTAADVVHVQILGRHTDYYNSVNAKTKLFAHIIGVALPLCMAALLLLGSKSAAVFVSYAFAGMICIAGAAVLLFLKVPAPQTAATQPPATQPLAKHSIAGALFGGLFLAFKHPVLRRYLLLSSLRLATIGALLPLVVSTYISSLTTKPAQAEAVFTTLRSLGILGTTLAVMFLTKKPDPKSGVGVLDRHARWSAMLRALAWLAWATMFFADWISSQYAIPLALGLFFITGFLRGPGDVTWDDSIIASALNKDFPDDQLKIKVAIGLFNTLLPLFGVLVFTLLGNLPKGINIASAVATLVTMAVFDLRLAYIGIPTSSKS